MKKFVFLLFLCLFFTGCKKCIEYSSSVSYRYVTYGSGRVQVIPYHKCIRYEEIKK